MLGGYYVIKAGEYELHFDIETNDKDNLVYFCVRKYKGEKVKPIDSMAIQGVNAQQLAELGTLLIGLTIHEEVNVEVSLFDGLAMDRTATAKVAKRLLEIADSIEPSL